MVVIMTIRLSFEGVCTWAWENFMRAFGELKTTMGDLLVALKNIVRAFFRIFFKLHLNSLLLLLM
jgi:hypothetical protein